MTIEENNIPYFKYEIDPTDLIYEIHSDKQQIVNLGNKMDLKRDFYSYLVSKYA